MALDLLAAIPPRADLFRNIDLAFNLGYLVNDGHIEIPGTLLTFRAVSLHKLKIIK